MTPKTKKYVIELAAANLLPLVGVIALGWSMLEIFLIYWIESTFIGLLALHTVYQRNIRWGLFQTLLTCFGALVLLLCYAPSVYVMFVVMGRDTALFWRPDGVDLTPIQVMTQVPFIIGALAVMGSAVWAHFTKSESYMRTAHLPAMVPSIARISALLVVVTLGYGLLYVIPTTAGTFVLLILAKCLGEWWVVTKRKL